LEVDRLKADFQCDQVKFQQLERELADLKLEQSNTDNSSTHVEIYGIYFVKNENILLVFIESS